MEDIGVVVAVAVVGVVAVVEIGGYGHVWSSQVLHVG